jgi:hypothetical protein
MERVELAIHELRKAYNCLYIAVEPSVAEDVGKRVEELIDAFRERINKIQVGAQ